MYLKPKIIDAETGRIIERERSMTGLFYYSHRGADGKTAWVGIIHLPGDYRRLEFSSFRACLMWLLGEERGAGHETD